MTKRYLSTIGIVVLPFLVTYLTAWYRYPTNPLEDAQTGLRGIEHAGWPLHYLIYIFREGTVEYLDDFILPAFIFDWFIFFLVYLGIVYIATTMGRKLLGKQD